nr:FliM/FliN family flagellar motor switch protein [uncultured Paludibaculum sp.]
MDELSAGQLRKAQIIHETLVAALAARLSALLRQPVQVTLEKLERDDPAGCMARIDEQSTLAVLGAPGGLRAAMFMGNGVLLSVIERLLGGAAGEHIAARTLTAVELKLLSRLLEKLMPDFHACWDRAISGPVTLNGLHDNPEMATVFSSDDDLMAFACRIQLGYSESAMRLVLPIRVLVKMLEAGSGVSGAAITQESDPVRSQIRDTLLLSEVEVEVMLNGNSLPLAALARIRPGSLLVLDSKVDRQVEAIFNQSVRKKGQVLRDGAKRLFRIQEEKASS